MVKQITPEEQKARSLCRTEFELITSHSHEKVVSYTGTLLKSRRGSLICLRQQI
jgi:hypothetical protein